MTTLRETTVRRIRELRGARGMTQQDLATRLSLLGARVDRTTVAKVENGSRELTLGEAFQYAHALDVAPVHLFVPTDSDEPISLGPNMEASPAELRNWIRGFLPIFQDPRVYFTVVPLSETKAAGEALATWEQTSPIQVTTSPEGES